MCFSVCFSLRILVYQWVFCLFYTQNIGFCLFFTQNIGLSMGFSGGFSLRILVYQWVYLFVFQNKLLEEGQEYAVMMYTWRCCSRALPQVRLIPSRGDYCGQK